MWSVHPAGPLSYPKIGTLRRAQGRDVGIQAGGKTLVPGRSNRPFEATRRVHSSVKIGFEPAYGRSPNGRSGNPNPLPVFPIRGPTWFDRRVYCGPRRFIDHRRWDRAARADRLRQRRNNRQTSRTVNYLALLKSHLRLSAILIRNLRLPLWRSYRCPVFDGCNNWPFRLVGASIPQCHRTLQRERRRFYPCSIRFVASSYRSSYFSWA